MPAPILHHFLEQKYFFSRKIGKRKFLLVNNMLNFSLFIEQVIQYKTPTTLSTWVAYAYIHACLKMQFCLEMRFPTCFDKT